MYLAKELTGASYKVIGIKFGKYDYSSVRYGIERSEALIKEDFKVKKDVECLENIYRYKMLYEYFENMIFIRKRMFKNRIFLFSLLMYFFYPIRFFKIKSAEE